jgi:predicted P-loop ATPase
MEMIEVTPTMKVVKDKIDKKDPPVNKYIFSENYLKKRYEFRRNTLSIEIEHRPKYSEHPFKSVNENSLYRELQKTNFGTSMANVISLLKSDFVPEYDPLKNYFKNLKYDGNSHIDLLAGYIKAIDQDEWVKHFKKHLVRTVACALVPDYFNKQALIIIQSKQNSGKSSFIRFLCPPALSEYIAEDVSTDKDSRILLVKNFIINLDELDKLSKQEAAAVKSFISKVQINERLPYDRKNSILKRRASFFGSTNSHELLDDPTGSVRWLCFEITDIDWKYKSKIDINQVWAEAYHLFMNGFDYELNKSDIQKNEVRNKNFQKLTAELQLIQKLFEPVEDELDRNINTFMTATDVWQKIVDNSKIGYQLNVIQVGKALKYLGFPEGKESNTRIKGYYIRLKLSTNENNLPNLPGNTI